MSRGLSAAAVAELEQLVDERLWGSCGLDGSGPELADVLQYINQLTSSVAAERYMERRPAFTPDAAAEALTMIVKAQSQRVSEAVAQVANGQELGA